MSSSGPRCWVRRRIISAASAWGDEGNFFAAFFAAIFFAGFFVIAVLAVLRCRAPQSKSCPNVSQRYHERHRLTRARVEAKRKIKALRLLRYCVNHNAANSDRIGCLRHAASGTAKESTADASPLPIQIHGQTSQYCDRDGVGHIPHESARSLFDRNHAGSQGTIADHTTTTCPSLHRLDVQNGLRHWAIVNWITLIRPKWQDHCRCGLGCSESDFPHQQGDGRALLLSFSRPRPLLKSTATFARLVSQNRPRSG